MLQDLFALEMIIITKQPLQDFFDYFEEVKGICLCRGMFKQWPKCICRRDMSQHVAYRHILQMPVNIMKKMSARHQDIYILDK